jgi:hypothetical protein
MADISPDMIICKFAALADQWVARFERRPQFAFGGDLPMTAVHRLLDGTEAGPDTYPLVCDADRAGSGVLHRDLIWQSPDVLFPCSTCRGTGQYTGLCEVETCQVCGGRKVVPA